MSYFTSAFLSAFMRIRRICSCWDLREQLILCAFVCLCAYVLIFCLFWIYTVTDLDYGHFLCLFFLQLGKCVYGMYCSSAQLLPHTEGVFWMWLTWKHLHTCICGRTGFQCQSATVCHILTILYTQTHIMYTFSLWYVEWPWTFVHSCLDFNVLIILRG